MYLFPRGVSGNGPIRSIPTCKMIKIYSTSKISMHDAAIELCVFVPSTCILLTLARACAAKGYCSRSVGLFLGRLICFSARFLSNRGCCRCQTWICGYVQRALGTARV